MRENTMLQLLSALGLFGTVVMVLACVRLRRGRGTASTSRFPRLERLLAAAAGLSFLALALSGFGIRLTGSALSGYPLLLHVGGGAVLAAAFTLGLLFWAPRFGFEAGATGCPAYCPGQRLGFWLLAVAVIGAIVTPLVAMLPWFGTHGQEVLVTIHRLCALAIVALALSLALAEARLRQAPR
jgi:cytochrome b subunit of formate dehydrogenase